jgi:SagB-type dehydrogenase family enzyme
MLTRVLWGLLIIFPLAASATENPDSMSIGPRFHLETSYNQDGFKGKSVSWGQTIPPYKEYPGADKVKLPAPEESGADLVVALDARRSVRSFADRALKLEQLSRLLLSADGISHARGSVAMRTAPSGGALYPIDIYVAVSDVEGLKAGLYHYRPADSSLELVEAGDFDARLNGAAFEQGCVGSSPVTIVLTARFERSTKKYADRGYRYTYMEGGAICQNVYLQANALQMGTVAVGAFNDDALNELLGIDGSSEAALLIMPVGYPAGSGDD